MQAYLLIPITVLTLFLISGLFLWGLLSKPKIHTGTTVKLNLTMGSIVDLKGDEIEISSDTDPRIHFSLGIKVGATCTSYITSYTLASLKGKRTIQPGLWKVYTDPPTTISLNLSSPKTIRVEVHMPTFEKFLYLTFLGTFWTVVGALWFTISL